MTKGNIIILVVFNVLICIRCSTQNNINNNVKMKNLSSNILKDIKIKQVLQYTDNDTIHELKEMDEYILEEKYSTGNRLITIVAYDKQEGFVIGTGQKFSDMLIGVFKKFDKEGKVINETNYDENFAFDLNSLIIKVKQELDLNLNDQKYIVLRYVDEGVPSYFIRYEYNIDGFKYIKVDGTSGDIIFNKFVPRTE